MQKNLANDTVESRIPHRVDEAVAATLLLLKLTSTDIFVP